MAWAGVIFLLSNQPTLPGPHLYLYDFLFKKLAHIFVFAVLYWLTFRLVWHSTHRASWRLFLPVMLCIFYSVSDELHQSLIPNRYPTLRDVGFDSLGVLLAFLRKYKYW